MASKAVENWSWSPGNHLLNQLTTELCSAVQSNGMGGVARLIPGW